MSRSTDPGIAGVVAIAVGATVVTVIFTAVTGYLLPWLGLAGALIVGAMAVKAIGR